MPLPPWMEPRVIEERAEPRFRRAQPETLGSRVTRSVPGRSGSARAADQVREQPPRPRRARGDLTEKTQSNVGPGPAADPGLDEPALLLARVLGEGVGHRDQLQVPRVARL